MVASFGETDLCTCGEALPTHLLEIAVDMGNADKFNHTCSCEKHYVIRGGHFIQMGTKPNPFMHAGEKE